jgi:DNA modification methylase
MDAPAINEIHHMDALEFFKRMPDQSVHCIVTSPPYFALRDYGTPDQIGQERTPDEYVTRLVGIFAEAHRVLRDDGTFWLNLGDTYANDDKWGGETGGLHAAGVHGTNVNRSRRETGLPGKSLIGIPWKVAFALQDAGWILRSDIIWGKGNPMPESVSDRPTRAHEYIFLLVKNQRYYYDGEAIKTYAKPDSIQRQERANSGNHKHVNGAPGQKGGTAANDHRQHQEHPVVAFLDEQRHGQCPPSR